MKLRFPAAAALLLLAGPAFGADLGRMFFTPAQRATLDNARKQNIRVEFSDDTAEQPAAAPAPQNISVNGLIRRSDGKNTVWLNNRPVTEENSGGLKVSTPKGDDRVHLTVPESGRSVDLKVGQTVETVSGTIEENYSRRAAKPNANAAPEGAAATPDKGAPSAAAQAPAADGAQKKREVRNRESDLLYDMQRLNDTQSK